MTTHVAVRRTGATLVALAIMGALLLLVGNTASAAIVPTVPLATSANYAVLGGSTVTNTGPSILDGSLGLWPGPSITGFPPGLVLPPGTTDVTNAAAQQAQSDLTAAYVDAAGRPLDATTTADLANLTLQGGVYAGPSKGALGLTGPLVLDGAGNPSTVFIFQTNSTLITGSGSTVSLINGAQECNVFWQVGSSATLGTGSVFVGNILALTSITVENGVTVHGRALARNGAVTLDNDVFTEPSCATAPPPTTTTTAPPGPTATTLPPGPTATTAPPADNVTPVDIPDQPASPVNPAPPVDAAPPGITEQPAPPADSPPTGEDSPPYTRLPRTGRGIAATVLVAVFAITVGAVAVRFSKAATVRKR